jgi:CBS domain-containing protein
MPTKEDVILDEEKIATERETEANRLATAILSEPIRSMATLKPALCVPPSMSVRSVIDRMNENRVGCVLVEDEDQESLLGIFTERDILTKIIAQGLDIDETAVSTVMTKDPEILCPDDLVTYALNKMSLGGFRHIPLVERGRPVGLVSMRNVVDYMVEIFRTEVLTLPPDPQNISRAREGA